MRDEWGQDQEYLKDSWPTEALPPERLPVVVAARANGWYLAPDAPVWSFLPAVWPVTARAWVPDRAVRHTRLQCEGSPEVTIPWTAWDHHEDERFINAILTEAGLPPRPFGRLWLLRPPPHLDDLDGVEQALVEGADAAGIGLQLSTELVGWARVTVAGWFADGG